MATTSAQVLVGAHRFEQMQIPKPAPPDAGLIIEVTANGICGSDLHFAGHTPRAPLVLGHEIVGTVSAFGPNHPRTDAEDSPLAEGDSVALFPWVPCHVCWACRRFGPGATTCSQAFVYGVPTEELGLPPQEMSTVPAPTGGFSRHVAVRAGTYLWKVPGHLPARIASLLDPLAVAVRTVDLARTPTGTWDEVLVPDSTAVVLGAGAVGLLTALVLRRIGIGTVVVSGSRPGRLSAAADIGADTVLDRNDTTTAQRRAAVLEMTSGRGADLVVDAANSPEAFEEALGMVRRLGTVIEVGNIVSGDHSVPVDPARDICQRNIRLLGVSFNPPRSYAEAMALLRRHDDIPFDRLITGEYSFDQISLALSALTGDEVKVTLTA